LFQLYQQTVKYKNVGLKGYGWLSLEDKRYFSLIRQYDVFIMGRKTYLGIGALKKLETNKLRIVLTSEPEKYNVDKIPGKLESGSESLGNIDWQIKFQMIKHYCWVRQSIHFIQVRFIDELHLTIEPRIFGKVKPCLRV
jgi:dihydrofolate reductase